MWAIVCGMVLLGLGWPGKVEAVEIPRFPSCVNPEGTVIADYASGTHGVPGIATTYTGSDKVYWLGESQVLQCLCPDEHGIETHWWKYSEVSNDDMKVLLDQGWVYIPTGKAWGLNDDPYLAKNSEYWCGGGGVGGSSGSGDSGSNSGSGGSEGVGGSVLGLSSLAMTGSKQQAWKMLIALMCGWIGWKLTRKWLTQN